MDPLTGAFITTLPIVESPLRYNICPIVEEGSVRGEVAALVNVTTVLLEVREAGFVVTLFDVSL